LNGSRILVVYFSRTGTTRKVAELLARLLRADLEEIRDTEDRMGVRGYFRSGREAFFQRRTVLKQPQRDPASYDLVVIGTPIWNLSLSSPVRTYLMLMRVKLPRVAFFLTHKRFGDQRVLAQMEQMVGKAPVARLVLKQEQVDRGGFIADVEPFVERLVTGGVPRPPPGPPAEHAASP
jgi:flavodoxin